MSKVLTFMNSLQITLKTPPFVIISFDLNESVYAVRRVFIRLSIEPVCLKNTTQPSDCSLTPQQTLPPYPRLPPSDPLLPLLIRLPKRTQTDPRTRRFPDVEHV